MDFAQFELLNIVYNLIYLTIRMYVTKLLIVFRHSENRICQFLIYMIVDSTVITSQPFSKLLQQLISISGFFKSLPSSFELCSKLPSICIIAIKCHKHDRMNAMTDKQNTYRQFERSIPPSIFSHHLIRYNSPAICHNLSVRQIDK